MGFQNVIERIRRKRERTAVDKTIELSARVKQVEGAISSETGLLGESAVEFEYHLTPTEMIGHRIGARYEILEVREGGMGFVYKCCDHELKRICAVKTFKDELLTSVFSHVRFHREALAWVELDKHPNIVRAFWVDFYGIRPYLVMEYIAPNAEGKNTLTHFLDCSPLPLNTTLDWAIQFCYGMEHAYSKGLVCHRDIKPGNILIDANGNVKITDFGIAKTFDSEERESIPLFPQGGGSDIYMTKTGCICGTPFWMSPEQFERPRDADQHSDIYSFGVVLFQMANEGKLPFWTQPPPQNAPIKEREKFFRELYQLQKEEKVPRINTPLFPIIERCMEKDPEGRYSSFSELRKDLEDLLHSEYQQVVEPPKPDTLTPWEQSEKAISWVALGTFTGDTQMIQRAEALAEDAVHRDPENVMCWNNLSWIKLKTEKYHAAIKSCKRALQLEPNNTSALTNLGVCYAEIGEKEKAIEMYRQAQKINPDRPLAFINEADALIGMGQFDDALQRVEHVLSLDSHFAGAWEMKGAILIEIGDYQQALPALNNALKFNPFSSDTWNRRGDVYRMMMRWQDALKNYNQALQFDPNNVRAMDGISFILYKQGKLKEALKWSERAVRTDPNDPEMLVGKGLVLRTLGRPFDALDCYNRAIEMDHDYAPAYSGKGSTLLMIKDVEGAKENYMRFVRLAEGDPKMNGNVEAMKGLLRNMGVGV